MDADNLINLQYLNKELYNDIKNKADIKYGTKNTINKLKKIYIDYIRQGGKAILDKNQVKEPDHPRIQKWPEVKIDFGPISEEYKKRGLI